MLFVLCLSACVVENEVESESDQEAPEVDAGVEVDASNEPEADVQPEPPESCMQEDDLFGRTPAVIPIGFSRDDLFLCPDTTDVFELSGEPGQEVLIKLGAEPLQNDLDLTLIDLEGNVLASSAEENGAESVVFSFSELVPTVDEHP